MDFEGYTHKKVKEWIEWHHQDVGLMNLSMSERQRDIDQLQEKTQRMKMRDDKEERKKQKKR